MTVVLVDYTLHNGEPHPHGYHLDGDMTRRIKSEIQLSVDFVDLDHHRRRPSD